MSDDSRYPTPDWYETWEFGEWPNWTYAYRCTNCKRTGDDPLLINHAERCSYA